MTETAKRSTLHPTVRSMLGLALVHRGLTQAEAARRLGVSRQYVGQLKKKLKLSEDAFPKAVPRPPKFCRECNRRLSYMTEGEICQHCHCRRITLTCMYVPCGKTFTRERSGIEGPSWFCSRSCYQAHRGGPRHAKKRKEG